MNEVAFYDKTEANYEKKPTPFNDFTYDNEENGGVLNKFSEIGEKIKSIKTDISNLNTEYGNIIKKYEAFSNFETSMNSIINTMSTRIDNINTCYNNILSTAQQAVKDHVASDKTLIDDLDSINALLAGKTGLEAGLNGTASNPSSTSNPSFNKTQEELDKMPTAEKEKYLAEKEKYEKDLEFKNSHGGYSEESWNHLPDTAKQDILKNQAAREGGKISDQNETAVEDKYSMSSDLDKVADEIIQGKYGNGEDRYAELEKQGYNLRDKYDENGNLVERGVQDIVNEKMNGTYDPNKTQTNTSNESGYRSTTSANAEAQAAVEAAQERGKAQTEYYQKQQAQAAANAAQERGKAQTEYYQNQQAQAAANNSTSTAGANSRPTQQQIIQNNLDTSKGTNNTSSQFANTNYNAVVGNNNNNNSTYNPSMDFNPFMYGGNNNSVNPGNYTNNVIQNANSNNNTASTTSSTTTTSSGSGIYELPSDPVE